MLQLLPTRALERVDGSEGSAGKLTRAEALWLVEVALIRITKATHPAVQVALGHAREQVAAELADVMVVAVVLAMVVQTMIVSMPG